MYPQLTTNVTLLSALGAGIFFHLVSSWIPIIYNAHQGVTKHNEIMLKGLTCLKALDPNVSNIGTSSSDISGSGLKIKDSVKLDIISKQEQGGSVPVSDAMLKEFSANPTQFCYNNILDRKNFRQDKSSNEVNRTKNDRGRNATGGVDMILHESQEKTASDTDVNENEDGLQQTSDKHKDSKRDKKSGKKPVKNVSNTDFNVLLVINGWNETTRQTWYFFNEQGESCHRDADDKDNPGLTYKVYGNRISPSFLYDTDHDLVFYAQSPNSHSRRGATIVKGIDFNSKRPEWIQLPEFSQEEIPKDATIRWQLGKMWLHSSYLSFSFYTWSIEGTFGINNFGKWDFETYKAENFNWKNCLEGGLEVKNCTRHESQARLLTRETKMVRISRTKVKNQNVYQLYINDVVDFKRKDGTIGFLHFLVDFEDMWFLDVDKPSKAMARIGRRASFEDRLATLKTMSIGGTVIYSFMHRLEFWSDEDELWTPVHKKDYEVGPGYYEMVGKAVFFPVPYKMAKECFENLKSTN